MSYARLLMLIGAWCCSAVAAARDTRLDTDFHVLAYHDVRDYVAAGFDRDQYAISTRNLIDHLSWLDANGFVPVTVDAILAARDGGPPLPEKAVLLTFDDGFKSVYTRVLPILKLFGYPAVVSIVTDWIENDVAVEQGGAKLMRDDFLSWARSASCKRRASSRSRRTHTICIAAYEAIRKATSNRPRSRGSSSG